MAKKETDMSSNDSDVTVNKLHEPMDQIQQGWEKNNLKREKLANNYRSHITKVIEEMKHTLSKFSKKMHFLELKHLKNEIANRYDAKNIVFNVRQTISKLKKELRNQEELLTTLLLNHGQIVQHNHNNKNNLQSRSKISRGERSLYDATQINNANCIWNDHVSMDRCSEKKYEISEFNVNEKVAFWNELNRVYILRGMTEKRNFKTKTKNKKYSLRKKLKSEKVQISDDSDVNSTCSTVPLFLMKDRKVDDHSRIRENKNKNKLFNKLKSSFSHTFKSESTELRSCKSEEADLEVESVNSSISSTFSAYIVPSIWENSNNGNSTLINPASIKSKGGILDEKIFMSCEVVLNKF